MAHSPWPWLWPSPHRDCPPPLSSLLPQHSSLKFNYKKARWDDYQSYIVELLPSLDVDSVNILQAARSFSLFLVEAAKASILFGRLGRSPKAWWSQESESAVRERRRARSEAHQSEAHRLRYIDASLGRPQSFLKPNPQPGKQAILICSPVLILVLSLGFSMPSRAKRTASKTPLFPVAVSLLTLPITTPLIFAYIYLKQHLVPRAEPNDSSWMNSGKLAMKMLLPY